MNNTKLGVTGMLLYENGSFFQVIEGPSKVIEELFQVIHSDNRHHKVVTIIAEPIVKRSFSDWTMGFARLSPDDVCELLGLNDFFTHGNSLNQLNPTRAKKLLTAFKKGRWQARLDPSPKTKTKVKLQNDPSQAPSISKIEATTFCAFQAIADTDNSEVLAYEAMPCDIHGNLLQHGGEANTDGDVATQNDLDFWMAAIKLVSTHNEESALIFTLRAEAVANAHSAIRVLIEVGKQLGVEPSRLILKINQENLIGEPEMFARMMQEFRGVGLKIAIDEFGSGRASSNLLETYQPDFISLNQNLVENIHSQGARQAIVRGVHQTCLDLGIDIIANHISSFAEYEWFHNEGVFLFQGDIIASPTFKSFPTINFNKFQEE